MLHVRPLAAALTVLCLGLAVAVSFGASPPAMVFPRNPGPPGAPLPDEDNTSGILDFNRLDYEGAALPPSTTDNQRMFWVLDPLGSGRTVIKLVVLDNDVADLFGGQRTVLGQTSSSHVGGDSAWFAWGYYLGANNAVTAPGDSFIYPSRPATLMGNYSTGGGGPAQSLILSKGVDGVRDSFAFGIKTLPGTCSEGQSFYDAGPAARGKWYYFIEYVKFSTGGAGSVKAWARPTNPPNVFSDPPSVDVQNINTLYPLYPGGEPNIMLERIDGASSGYPFTAYLWGYGRGGTAIEAVTNAGLCTGKATDVVFDTTGFGASSGGGLLTADISASWTVPGGTCPPNLYDIRVSLSPITEANFSSAFNVFTVPSLAPDPGVPGTSQTIAFTACPALTYHIAVRARFGTTWGPISNVAIVTLAGAPIADCFANQVPEEQ